MKQLAIVIVNYNVRFFLELALQAVYRAVGDLDVEVWVVDNNSSDDSVEMVKELYPQVRLIANKDNPGFSIANNQAIRLSDSKYVLLLNPDTVVREDTFQVCIDFMDLHEEYGSLGVKMVDGSGLFLPESKRGFPTPWVAFAKTFGLSSLFPKSKVFNRYHLGFINKDSSADVDVLSGAFMFMRRSALQKVGLLDEQFFMYGEDIDLSYRVKLDGWKNYYLADTQIIHYKGESTKKDSVNYVRIFYQAMILFARKHFSGSGSFLFIFMLKMAIYFRASLTLLGNVWRKAKLLVFEAGLVFLGLCWVKRLWAVNYYHNPDYYDSSFYYINAPLYILIWLGGVFFSGGYDTIFNVVRITRGLFFGGIILVAIYGLLPLEYRPSRAILLLGFLWSFLVLLSNRYLLHFLRYGNFNLSRDQRINLVFVGSELEDKKAQELLRKVDSQNTYIGRVGVSKGEDGTLGDMERLLDIVDIYKVKELIFSFGDVSAAYIMNMMEGLGQEVLTKIMPINGGSIIGSYSKNQSGQLYTMDVHYEIDSSINRRNKRIIDVILSILLIVLSPIVVWRIRNKTQFFVNIASVFVGSVTWVGYGQPRFENHDQKLPKLKSNVLSIVPKFSEFLPAKTTVEKLNFLYAKDYRPFKDIERIIKSIKDLGNKPI